MFNIYTEIVYRITCVAMKSTITIKYAGLNCTQFT